MILNCFFFSSRRRHTRYIGDWSSDVCSSDLQFCSIAERSTKEFLLLNKIVFEVLIVIRFICTKPSLHLVRIFRVLFIRSEERRVGKECRSWWLLLTCRKKGKNR